MPQKNAKNRVKVRQIDTQRRKTSYKKGTGGGFRSRKHRKKYRETLFCNSHQIYRSQFVADEKNARGHIRDAVEIYLLCVDDFEIKKRTKISGKDRKKSTPFLSKGAFIDMCVALRGTKLVVGREWGEWRNEEKHPRYYNKITSPKTKNI